MNLRGEILGICVSARVCLCARACACGESNGALGSEQNNEREKAVF